MGLNTASVKKLLMMNKDSSGDTKRKHRIELKKWSRIFDLFNSGYFEFGMNDDQSPNSLLLSLSDNEVDKTYDECIVNSFKSQDIKKRKRKNKLSKFTHTKKRKGTELKHPCVDFSFPS